MFQGLVSCENCRSSFTMEIKKKKYIYYHYTNSKRNCSKIYVREEKLEKQVIAYLGEIRLPDDFLPLVAKALKESADDVESYRKKRKIELDALSESYHKKLRILYDDRLDGRISTSFFDDMTEQLKLELSEVEQKVHNLTQANHNHIEEGIQIIELARNATMTYSRANMSQKRTLLKFLLSNFSFEDGKLTPEWRKPFDLLSLMRDEFNKKIDKTQENVFCPLEYTQRESNP